MSRQLAFVGLLLVAGCSASDAPSRDRGGLPTGGASGAAGMGASGGIGGIGGSSANGGTGGGAGGSGSSGAVDGGDCAGVTARAEAELLPTDVIWAIDTSGSMNASFPAIQAALTTFSDKVVAAGIDAHIILLAGAGGGGGLGTQGLCVPAPLGSGNCGAAASAGGSAADSKEPGFLHLDLPFGATAGMATLLDNHAAYKHLLRPNARTQLVLTEDGAPPMTAAAVTGHVEGVAPATATAAWSPGLMPGSYRWNGVICSAGTGTGTCLFAFGLPQTTLDLIQQSMGLLGNLDDAGKAGATDPFAALLDALAEAVIVGARVSCDYAIPPAPAGKTFDPALVNVVYSSGDLMQVIPRAPKDVECMGEQAWKYDSELSPTRVVLCPAACSLVQGDASAQVDVSFGCETMLLVPD